MMWRIFSPKGMSILVRAETFNEALKKARMRDESFCAGYVVDDGEE